MGKSSAPPAPDYSSAAKETASGNLDATRAATKANRINQVTPYGSLTYSQTGSDPDAGWTQTQTLSPQAQAALDQQLSLNKKYGETANVGFDKARASLENPELDMSQLPQRGINVGQTAQQAIMSRLNPQMQQREEQLRQQMANQGIGLGSTAFGREMTNYNQGRNDLEMQAALQGINLDQQNRSAALQEQAYIKDRPLNLINALRTGNQVQNPQFQQFAQQATTQGANMLGAAQAQYGADVNSTNTNNANQQALMGGLFDVGAGLAGMPGAGGSISKGFKGLFA